MKYLRLAIVTGLSLLILSNSTSAQINKTFNISDDGAVGNGQKLNTGSIQRTIDRANAAGGGTVIIPKGRFLTGMLQLKSNVTLHLASGAFLLGSTNPFDYTELPMKGHPKSPKQDDNSSLALLVAYRANNIAITGPGTIDGQGTALALNIDSLYYLGKIKDPHHSSRPNETVRPKLLLFSTCKNVKIQEATLKNSACWGLSFELCDQLLLDKIRVINRAYWNNDGTDLTDCRNVRITNCDFNSADDGICLKSYYPGFSNDSFYIDNCTIRSGASAVKFGTASYGGFKNIVIDHIKIFDTYRSAIAIESVDGGDIENIRVTNIIAKNTGNGIFIRLGNRIRKVPGKISNLYIGNVKVEIPFGRPDINYDLRAPEPGFHNAFASSITGIPGYKVSNITLENIEITYPGRASKAQAYFPIWRLKDYPEKTGSYPEFSMFGETPAWGLYVRHTENLKMNNIVLKLSQSDFRPAIILDDAQGVKLDNIKLPAGQKHNQILARESKNVTLQKSGNLEIEKVP